MPTRVQAKLHRVLRDREAVLTRDRSRLELDIRPIAAVEPGIRSAVEEGRLRRDLYERLSLIRIELPPLRQRREDVPFLANHFLKEICRANGAPLKTLTRSAVTLLAALPWRGNAPELRGAARATRAADAARVDSARGRAGAGAARRQRGGGGGRHDAARSAAPFRARLHRRRSSASTTAGWATRRRRSASSARISIESFGN